MVDDKSTHTLKEIIDNTLDDNILDDTDSSDTDTEQNDVDKTSRKNSSDNNTDKIDADDANETSKKRKIELGENGKQIHFSIIWQFDATL